ncbi:MAG TPA: PleD family two-component system response regulator [Micropepsaceae bacterium]|nr:PleD family two-component system response regulator [Micropepsaceae bacterium]
MTARVLVVDDIPVNVRLLEAKLSAEYFHVQTASDGEEALAKIHDEPPDIVLLDVMMPGMDGFEVCRRMKQDPAFAHVPVVMVTALGQPADRIKGLDAGADDFLTKPVDDLSMFARVRSLVRMKSMFEELRMREETRQNLGLSDGTARVIESDPTGRILFIDDRADLPVWVNTLSALGNEVTGIRDFNAALRHTDGESYDAIIVSVSSPAFDGLRLISEFRANPALRNTPVIALVAAGEHRNLAQALDLGANDYLHLPLDRSEFIVRLKTQLRKKRYADLLRQNVQRGMEMAVKDHLTGLFNRRYMSQHLETLLKCASEAKPISLLIMDIDYFSRVNNSYGHLAGDDVLRQFAGRLMENIRGVDLACRYGGEEFVVVLSDTDPHTAWLVGERLRRAVEKLPFDVEQPSAQIPVTVSIGVASSFGGDDQSAALLRRADQALYRAKDEGRNRVIAEAA